MVASDCLRELGCGKNWEARIEDSQHEFRSILLLEWASESLEMTAIVQRILNHTLEQHLVLWTRQNANHCVEQRLSHFSCVCFSIPRVPLRHNMSRCCKTLYGSNPEATQSRILDSIAETMPSIAITARVAAMVAVAIVDVVVVAIIL